MPNITITMKPRQLFTDELRNLLASDLVAGNAAGVIGVSDGYDADSDDMTVKQGTSPCAWVMEDERIVQRNLYGAPFRVIRQVAAAQFAVFGDDTFNRSVETEIESMVVHKDLNTTYTALCLSFGVMILSSNPPISMSLDAKAAGLSEITHDIVRANISVLTDKGLSNHARLDIGSRVENFLNHMVHQSYNARMDRDGFAPWLKDLSFTAIPG